MTEKYDRFATQVKTSWSPPVRAVFEETREKLSDEMRERESLGVQLAQARTQRGVSQQTLADCSGVHQAEISRIERGLGNPTAATLMRLLDALEYELTLTPLQR